MKYKTDIIKVRYSETDQMGIVHHSNYLKFFEIARIEWLENLKMPYEKIEENDIRIHTVEHALAAVSGLRLDNILIELSGKEPPVMDGSAKDFVECLIKAGVKVIIQPGGSVRDREVIDAADKAKVKMIFTGIRHFNH